MKNFAAWTLHGPRTTFQGGAEGGLMEKYGNLGLGGGGGNVWVKIGNEMTWESQIEKLLGMRVDKN